MKRLLERAPVRFAVEMVDLYFSKRVARSAAELAYFLILSIFPVLICLNGFIGLLHVDIRAVLAELEGLIPGETMGVILDYVAYISANQSTALFVAGVTMTLFSASAAFRSLMDIMDDIYERKSYTGLRQIVASVIFSVLLLVTIYLSLVVL